jgi:hypothetical protein
MARKGKMTAAQEKEKQQKIDAGVVSDLFPKVAEISINMLYSQAGALKPLSRAVNFFPGSSAIFRLSCLCSECAEGRFDFTGIIEEMVKNRKTALKGKMSCENCDAPECADAAYSITIKYAQRGA